MTNLTKKFGTAAATVALMANAFAGVAAAGTTIEISGNGAGSENWATVEQSSTNTVTQNNNANVTNDVDSNANTGGNDANLNTGGDVMIDTGNASTDTTVENVLNSNSADVECCASGGTEVMISGNGANSDNGVLLGQESTTAVTQNNVANVTNNVNSDAKTGYNDANGNTGGGDVIIKTGKASVDTSVSTVANVNSARVSSNHQGSYPSASFLITGNGAGSDNYITAGLSKTTEVAQGNNAKITNDVDADAKSGGNDANLNTGGDVMIDTGDAHVGAMVDNSVNFNYADVDCGCTWDVTAKIAGNGAEEQDKYHGKYGRHHHNRADNIIDLTLNSAQAVGQGNVANLTNDLTDLDAKTGYNDADANTGDVDGDPSISTGNANVTSGVSNSGNVNTVGDGWNWPEVPSNVEFSFNFAAMMAFFGLSY